METIQGTKPNVRSYRDLIVWNKAMDLAVAVYQISSLLPTTERWRLIDQMNRAVASIRANIAEGQGGEHRRTSLSFFSIAADR